MRTFGVSRIPRWKAMVFVPKMDFIADRPTKVFLGQHRRDQKISSVSIAACVCVLIFKIDLIFIFHFVGFESKNYMAFANMLKAGSCLTISGISRNQQNGFIFKNPELLRFRCSVTLTFQSRKTTCLRPILRRPICGWSICRSVSWWSIR